MRFLFSAITLVAFLVCSVIAYFAITTLLDRGSVSGTGKVPEELRPVDY